MDLGELTALKKLDLSGNNFSGGVPTSLENHRNRRNFVFGVPPHGAPVPPYKSWLSVVVPLVLGYADLGTDVFSVISYYQVHMWWFAIGLTFLVGPALVAAIFFLREEDWYRRVFVALHLGLLVEALVSVIDEKYSHVLVSLRVVEPLYESVPQLMLQLYALLLEWKSDSSHWSQWLPLRLLSIVVSCASLSYAATGLVAEQPMSELSPANGVGSAWFPRLTGLVFGTVPTSGRVKVYGSHWHPQNFVWVFLVYQVIEIGSRFISLAILASVLREHFFPVLVWLLGSRYVILHYSLGGGQEHLRFRSQLRLVGVPFMDSVMDKRGSYDAGCALTTVEFLVCLIVGNTLSTDYTGQAPDDVRRAWSYVAVACMAGKLLLGCAIVRSFKASVSFGYDQQQQAPGVPDTGGRGAVVVDEHVARSGGTATKEAKVKREVAPLEGGQLQPAAHRVSTLATSTASGEVKVEDGLESV